MAEQNEPTTTAVEVVQPGTITPADSPEALDKTIAKAERYMIAIDSIRKLAIRMTNRYDWIDQSDRPYLQASGCAKISGGFGMQVYGVECEKERESDDTGEYMAYTTMGYGRWNNNEKHEIGTASTRDDFFAKRTKWENGEKVSIRLPMSEVDVLSVKKKSHTNFMNRLVKNLLGLSFTWDEIAEYSGGAITKATCQSVKYDKGKKGGSTDTAAGKDTKADIRRMISEMCDGEEAACKATLEELTQWTDKEGKVVAGRRSVDQLTQKQLPHVLRKVKAAHERWQSDMAAGYGDGEPGPEQTGDGEAA